MTYYCFSVRLNTRDARQLHHIARAHQRKRGDVMRLLIRREAARLNQTPVAIESLVGDIATGASAPDAHAPEHKESITP